MKRVFIVISIFAKAKYQKLQSSQSFSTNCSSKMKLTFTRQPNAEYVMYLEMEAEIVEWLRQAHSLQNLKIFQGMFEWTWASTDQAPGWNEERCVLEIIDNGEFAYAEITSTHRPNGDELRHIKSALEELKKEKLLQAPSKLEFKF